MKTLVFYFILALAALPAGFASGASEDNDSMRSDGMEGDSMMMEGDSSVEKTDGMTLPDEKGFYSTQGLQPRVVPFTTEEAAQVLAKKGPVVYFFAATWCPTCQATMKNLERNLARIPGNVTLVLVNYDTRQALKAKYGVTTQHTFVQINAAGDKVAVWVGSTTVDDIVRRIK
ncbi:MAG TPA: thioredoxin [Spirochaetia bacterium]|nr:thioredoxin [Spirochaetia bacterium]